MEVSPFTDEERFHLLRYIDSQNSRVWSATNPNKIKDAQFHNQKFGVRCAVSRNCIIGLIFFEYTVSWEHVIGK
jgi:hypothetical protein